MPERPLNRILCVEDEPDIRTIVHLTLETMGGFTVALAENGPAALARAPEFAPDLILLDVMMPGMDGPTTLGELRKLPALAGTPVVFMTAKVQPDEVARYLALGAVDVIVKPFDPMALPDRVKAIWQALP